MKNLRIIVLICASLAISSCEKDDDKNNDPSNGNNGGGGNSGANYMKVDGNETTLKAGVLEYYGVSDSTGLYNFDISLITTEVVKVNGDLEPADSNFTMIYFELFTKDSANLPIGTYSYSQKAKDFSLTYAEFGAVQDSVWQYIPSGTFKVLQNSPTYELSFTGTTFLGKPVSMHYKGALQKEDNSGGNISAPNKSARAKVLALDI